MPVMIMFLKNHKNITVMTCLFSNILQLALLALAATTSLAPLLVVWPILFGGGWRLVFRTSVDPHKFWECFCITLFAALSETREAMGGDPPFATCTFEVRKALHTCITVAVQFPAASRAIEWRV